MSKLSNTITILFADHGNAYGEFPQHHQQGRYEAYHPLLFLVVPEKVQKILGKLYYGKGICSSLCLNHLRFVLFDKKLVRKKLT